ncbi:sensor histidine kinase [Bosea sp. MMO-172]|uniref:sensor histidine kinase n=1 Tax=Bosea sp. MMO-172 TaxID=3127885 RepID=UPI00301A311A
MRAVDWNCNPLGRPEDWPTELRTIVSIALGSRQPMLIVWGPEQITLYNDGYAAMCGNRHPAALGKPFRDLWFDIWDDVDPIITDAYNGISTSMDDIAFIMHRNGYPEETHFAFSYTPVRDADNNVRGMFCACVETTAEVIMRRRLAREREQMLHVFEMALGAVAITTGPDHVFTFANRDYRMLVGHRDVVGMPVIEALPELAGQGFVPLLDRVYETGEAYVGRDVSAHLIRTPGGQPEERIVDFLYHPIRDAGGKVDGIFVQALDVTERADEARLQQLREHELVHRLKNQLALVQAIAGQSLRHAADLDSGLTLFNARIAALARVHDMLLAEGAERVEVSAVVADVVGLHDGNSIQRFSVTGPAVAIGARPALSLALILHELATNAVKYGALSNTFGTVTITWQIKGAPDRLVLEWSEAGGPPVDQPTRKGSGTRLLKAGIAGSNSSSVDVDYEVAGVRCVITADGVIVS